MPLFYVAALKFIGFANPHFRNWLLKFSHSILKSRISTCWLLLLNFFLICLSKLFSLPWRGVTWFAFKSCSVALVFLWFRSVPTFLLVVSDFYDGRTISARILSQELKHGCFPYLVSLSFVVQISIFFLIYTSFLTLFYTKKVFISSKVSMKIYKLTINVMIIINIYSTKSEVFKSSSSSIIGSLVLILANAHYLK